MALGWLIRDGAYLEAKIFEEEFSLDLLAEFRNYSKLTSWLLLGDLLTPLFAIMKILFDGAGRMKSGGDEVFPACDSLRFKGATGAGVGALYGTTGRGCWATRYLPGRRGQTTLCSLMRLSGKAI